MSNEVPLYEAKARLSALVRRVREGHRVIITVHGEPVAELRPIDRPQGDPSLGERIAELTERGNVQPAKHKPSDPAVFRRGERKPGALRRFLDDRE